MRPATYYSSIPLKAKALLESRGCTPVLRRYVTAGIQGATPVFAARTGRSGLQASRAKLSRGSSPAELVAAFFQAP